MRMVPLPVKIIFLILVLTGLAATPACGHAEETVAETAEETLSPQEMIPWVEERGGHFIIYTEYETMRVRDIMREAERYYSTIAERLKFPRHDDFWMWDDRVKIYLYADKATYLEETKEPEWSLGIADYTARAIYSYLDSPRFTTSVLPHEIAHLIFRDFYKKEWEGATPPYWLDEGVAQWSEDKETQDQIKKLARDLLKTEGLLPLADILLLNLDFVKKNPDRLHFRLVHTMKDRYSVVIMSPDVLTNNFYIQAGSLVGYLIETFGARRFANFCRQISQERAISNALRSAYHKHFQSLKDLENGWRAYLLKE